MVVNHTSNEHEWAQRARKGEQKYQDYYFVFDDRETPDIYEETMLEIFLATAPGNFTFTGRFPGSAARGLPFGENPKTGDARISDSFASLVGLEAAIENLDEAAIDAAIRTTVLLHSMILSFGGIPLLYYGDAIGLPNSEDYFADPAKRDDNRWLHRSHFDWGKAELRHQTGAVEHRIFHALKKIIALCKEVTAFADFDNRTLLSADNPNLLVFSRNDPQNSRVQVLVAANFNVNPQTLPVGGLRVHGFFPREGMKDLCSGELVVVENDAIVVPPLTCVWLTES